MDLYIEVERERGGLPKRPDAYRGVVRDRHRQGAEVWRDSNAFVSQADARDAAREALDHLKSRNR